MLVAYINDYYKTGVILGSYLSRKAAIKRRELSGDLIFDSNGFIDQENDWLFDWEKDNPNCYAQKARRARISTKEIRWSPN